jgi:poly(A) polymerase
MLKIFLSGEAASCCDLLRRTGLFASLYPHFSRWLDVEREGFPHTRFGQMLARIDEIIQQGGTVSAPLLLALLFGEYIDDKAEHFRRKGAPWQQSIDAAVAEFMGETCPIVMIMNRVAMALRDIISQQTRLKKIPGRKPEVFIARRDFCDITAYCRITGGDSKDVSKQLEWWMAQAEQQVPVLLPREEPKDSKSSQRKKKRRRRRNPPAKNTHKG